MCSSDLASTTRLRQACGGQARNPPSATPRAPRSSVVDEACCIASAPPTLVLTPQRPSPVFLSPKSPTLSRFPLGSSIRAIREIRGARSASFARTDSFLKARLFRGCSRSHTACRSVLKDRTARSFPRLQLSHVSHSCPSFPVSRSSHALRGPSPSNQSTTDHVRFVSLGVSSWLIRVGREIRGARSASFAREDSFLKAPPFRGCSRSHTIMPIGAQRPDRSVPPTSPTPPTRFAVQARQTNPPRITSDSCPLVSLRG